MDGTPYRIPNSRRMSARLSDATLIASVRLNKAYLALHPGKTLDDLYRPLLTKLMNEYERQCVARGIMPQTAVNRRSPLVASGPPTHIRKKKSPTYDEL